VFINIIIAEVMYNYSWTQKRSEQPGEVRWVPCSQQLHTHEHTMCCNAMLARGSTCRGAVSCCHIHVNQLRSWLDAEAIRAAGRGEKSTPLCCGICNIAEVTDLT
jgi:hypothetical protein